MATAPVSAESESGMHGGKGLVFTVTRPYLHTYINIYIAYIEYVARQRFAFPDITRRHGSDDVSLRTIQ